jgi:hypothetical protein
LAELSLLGNQSWSNSDTISGTSNKTIQALKSLGCKPSDQMQKYIYLQAFYWVYENKFITETQNFIFNSLLGLAEVVIACEALLTNSNKNTNF